MSRKSWVLLCVAVLVAAAAVTLAWPPADPFAGAETVALRTDSGPSSPEIDVAAELTVVLGDRNLRIVSDERGADVVLAVTDVRFDLGNTQLVLSGKGLTGRSSAVCRVVNAKTGHAYVMDLILLLEDGKVTADLVGRRFWEFWKPRPSL
jgi:hypothetical protein